MSGFLGWPEVAAGARSDVWGGADHRQRPQPPRVRVGRPDQHPRGDRVDEVDDVVVRPAGREVLDEGPAVGVDRDEADQTAARMARGPVTGAMVAPTATAASPCRVAAATGTGPDARGTAVGKAAEGAA